MLTDWGNDDFPRNGQKPRKACHKPNLNDGVKSDAFNEPNCNLASERFAQVHFIAGEFAELDGQCVPELRLRRFESIAPTPPPSPRWLRGPHRSRRYIRHSQPRGG
jgi:hypothetical protein